jgi:putative oxidoreductase
MASSLEARLDEFAPAVISLFRVVMGFLFTLSGTAALFGWPVNKGIAPIGSFPFWWAGVMFGLFTRLAAFIASGQMAVAYFWQHQPHGLLPAQNGGEGAVLYCFVFFLLVFVGGGAYSLDALRRTRQPAGAAAGPAMSER